MIEYMLCSHCGKEIDDDSSFCRYCGKIQTFSTERFPKQTPINSKANGRLFSSFTAGIVKLLEFVWNKLLMLYGCLKNFVSLIPDYWRRNRMKSILIIIISIMSLVGLYFLYGEFRIFREEKDRMMCEYYARNRAERRLNDYANPNKVYGASVFVLENNTWNWDTLDVSVSIPLKPYKTKAIENIKKLAEDGHVDAQFELGMYYYGFDFENHEFYDNDHFPDKRVNYEKSAYWFLQAALHGGSTAMYNLSICYFNGKGVREDPEKALYWLRKSVENGHNSAARLLGDKFRDGVWIKRMSDDFIIHSRCILPVNMDSAMYYWRLSAERGDLISKDRLQKIYE